MTPNHLIYDRTLNSVAVDNKNSDEELSNDNAKQRIKHVNNLLKHFWKRWANEYVTELREYQKSKNINDETLISENDIVLLVEEKQPRIAWRVERVVELIKGHDNLVREAMVITKSDQGRLDTLRRLSINLFHLNLIKTIKMNV